MIARVEHVGVTYLGWKQPKTFCVHDIVSLRSSKIVLKQSESVIHAKFSLIKCMHMLLQCFPSSLLAPSPSGGLIS
jgi:hypothetical protein